MAKKILYVCKYSLIHDMSLKNKYNGQIAGFKDIGLDCYYLAFDNEYYYLVHNNNMQKLLKIKNSASPLYMHFFAFVDMYKSALKAMKAIKFDYLYVRNDPIDINGINMYRFAKKCATKVITEVPSYPVYRENVRNPIRKIALYLSDRMLKYTSRFIDLYSIIGDSCTKYMDRPAINIENAVSVELFPQKQQMSDAKINIIAVASMSKWQGYDRAIKAIAEYKDRENICLRLVGNDGDGSLEEWKALAKNLGVEDCIEFIPARYGKELDDLIDKSDIGLATLALFRSKIKKASPLKVREYMSRGLPFVYSAEDISLDTSKNYIFKVAEDESPINMEDIVEFAKSIKHNENISIAMRKFAEENMSWSKEFKKIFCKLEDICRS